MEKGVVEMVEMAKLRAKARSVLQQEAWEDNQRRNELIQRGVRPPKSGVFGRVAK
jgi:hypothetical protein